MKFFEYQAKDLMRRFGIPTPEGQLLKTPEDNLNMPVPVMLKAQVLTGGRGKGGGILEAKERDAVPEMVSHLLNLKIKGFPVKAVLAEEKIGAEEELYLSFFLDRSARMPLLIASPKGGVDIESVDKKYIYSAHVNPLIGLSDHVVAGAAAKLTSLSERKEHTAQLKDIIKKLYRMYCDLDAELVEINPLMVTEKGEVTAGDAKLIVDGDALYRHPDIPIEEGDLTELEKAAKKKGISVVSLEGNIGIIANGAGLTMATMDVLTNVGGRGGVFLDLGGTDDPKKVGEAFRLMKMAEPSVILMNIFGGITRCDTVAKGLIEVLKEEGIETPIVARIKGNNDIEAKELLSDAGLNPADTIEEAARKAVELAERSG